MHTDEVLLENCELLMQAEWGKIWSCTPKFLTSECPQAMSVGDLYEKMSENKAADFSALIQVLAERGTTSSHKFRSEADGLWAIAIKGKQKQFYRFPCFRIKNNWIVVYGFTKERKNLWDQKYIDWANKIRTKINREIEIKNEQFETKTRRNKK